MNNSWSLAHCPESNNNGNSGRMQMQRYPTNNGMAENNRPHFIDMAPITVQVPWENGGDCGISKIEGLPQGMPVRYFPLKWEEIFGGANGVRVQLTQNGGNGSLVGQAPCAPKVYFQPVENYNGPTTTMRMTQGRR